MNKKFFPFLGALALLGAASCQPEEKFGEIGQAFATAEGTIGDFQLTQVVQVDNDAVDNNYPAEVQRMDLTSDYPFNQVVFSFQANGNEPSNFVVTNPGNAPVFLANGTWKFDDSKGPRKIIISQANGRRDTLQYGQSYRAADNRLGLKLLRRNGPKTLVTYELNFVRK
ncbi:DUF5004 domain-containing protein [Hymenobacter sp. BT664]|uniref:DUF5004 domain-containing protein n=1 Tax=Hymenobacter montanus TaxID=2771359 RepID=A0A927BAT6_9BACT|nr:DUF5004 domain-containing protein [Hymenobacter montanus]MBD2766697.1 DUF5004 domain-containing protein [Hymenobacter montanus]